MVQKNKEARKGPGQEAKGVTGKKYHCDSALQNKPMWGKGTVSGGTYLALFTEWSLESLYSLDWLQHSAVALLLSHQKVTLSTFFSYVRGECTGQPKDGSICRPRSGFPSQSEKFMNGRYRH